ncbi:hypothetical protein SDC9_115118 [bioreactor metagenome]|uniref:Uncharacterized protein n=1 Tax=bioreactor metagenome TaxID=1076179 RepID=A0A645BSH7_9ZZZZ
MGAHAAHPAFGVQVDQQVFGHRDSHRESSFRVGRTGGWGASVGVVEQQVTDSGDPEPPAGQHAGGEERPLDDRRALAGVARRQVVEHVHGHVVDPVGGGAHPAGAGDRGRPRLDRPIVGQHRVRQRCGDSEPQGHLLAGCLDRVAGVVGMGPDEGAVGLLHGQVPRGPAVGEVVALLEHVPLGPGHQLLMGRPDRLGRGGRDADLVRLADVGEGDAEGGEHRGRPWDEHVAHPGDAGRAGGAHRPGAAERGKGGVRGDDVGEAVGEGREVGLLHPDQGLLQRDAERLGDGLGDHRPGALRVQPEGPVHVRVGVEHAEQQVDVGDGRPAAAEAEAGGAGRGAHRPRADGDLPVLHGDDGGAAHPLGVHVAHRVGDRHALDAPPPVGGDLAAADDADVGRGAADVHHHGVCQPVDPGQRRGALQTAARAGGVRLEGDRLRHP